MTPARPRTQIAWGGIDQGLSSATNLGLSVLAGRFLGEAGLGVTFLGFAACMLALSIVRGFVTAPFVVVTAVLEPEDREDATRNCITLVVCAAFGVSVLMLLIGLVAPDPLGQSLVVFSPWAMALIVQDLWRSTLFRDQRGKAAAFNDGVWAVVMLVMVPIVWLHPHVWSVAAAWGGGAAGGAIAGFRQVNLRPNGLRHAREWWKRELRRLGSWMAAQSIMFAMGSQVTIIVLAALLTKSDLGGMRAIQVVFAPMTLIGEAMHYPGVPIMTRALATSLADARRWAWRLGLGAIALIGIYLAVLVPFRDEVLSRVFRPEFTHFTELILPTAISQFIWGSSIGFLILLKADRRVHATSACIVANTIATLTLTPFLAARYGVIGASWGLAFGTAGGAVASIVFGLRPNDISLRFWRDPDEPVVAAATDT
jgi:O-antigen/teichoic acid export membrane protein